MYGSSRGALGIIPFQPPAGGDTRVPHSPVRALPAPSQGYGTPDRPVRCDSRLFQ